MTTAEDDISDTLNSVTEQPVAVEIIVVTGQKSFVCNVKSVTVVASTGTTRGARLNTGAAAAKGDILLFLWPGNQLPVEALLTIEKNFAMLPQTTGGNFHVKFDTSSFLTNTAKRFLKKERYGGHYFGNSGIFARKDVFEELGGFKPLNFLEDYEFGQRLEAHGPTLFLPDKITVSTAEFRQRKLKRVLLWLVVAPLLKIGLSLPRLNAIAGKIGGK